MREISSPIPVTENRALFPFSSHLGESQAVKCFAVLGLIFKPSSSIRIFCACLSCLLFPSLFESSTLLFLSSRTDYNIVSVPRS